MPVDPGEPVGDPLTASASWDTSPLISANVPSKGVVVAGAEALECRAAVGQSADISWNSVPSYGAKGGPDTLVINAAPPWSWFIVLALDATGEEKLAWTTVLESRGVSGA